MEYNGSEHKPEIKALLRKAVSRDARDLRAGCWADEHRWIAFGEYNGKPLIWRILEVYETDGGSSEAFLFAEDAVDYMLFDDSSNDWDSSEIKRRLNEDFYRGAFSEQELNVEEAEDKRFFADDSDRAIGDWWWLRSPGNSNGRAADVFSYGEVYSGGDYSVDSERAVRPALKRGLNKAP